MSEFITRKVHEWVVTKWWGPRCTSRSSHCPCCKAWAIHDNWFGLHPDWPVDMDAEEPAN